LFSLWGGLLQERGKEVIPGLAVLITNMILFLGTVPYFLNKFHHHWIIPVFAAGLLFQSILFVRWDPSWIKPALRVVMSLGLLMGALLLWRQFSMFQCFRHCEGRLTVGLILLSGTYGVAWRFGPFNKSRLLSRTALVFLVWALIVLAIGVKHATWNFN
jgi:hypothetical protein